MVAAEFSAAKCYFIPILLSLTSESNSLNKIKKLIQKYNKESIYRKIKLWGGNSSLGCLDLNMAHVLRKEAKSYKDDNVRANQSDKRLILVVISASFSKNEVALDSRIEASCFSASKLR
jgi:hypothetical protein